MSPASPGTGKHVDEAFGVHAKFHDLPVFPLSIPDAQWPMQLSRLHLTKFAGPRSAVRLMERDTGRPNYLLCHDSSASRGRLGTPGS